MNGFATALQTACEKDLADRNSMALASLTALQAYSVMYDVGCLTDPTTSAYCYVAAARNPTPVDLYYYQLPLGTSLPKRAVPTCSSCTKSVMNIYAEALSGGTNSSSLTGLQKTYEAAAQGANQACGGDYAHTAVTNAGVGVEAGRRVLGLGLGMALMVWGISGGSLV